MRLDEFLDYDPMLIYETEELVEANVMAWGKKGNKLVRKYRCPFGKRKGRLVGDLSQCSKPIDMKRRQALKRTKATKGAAMRRKASKTKKFNPTSKRLRSMNKR